MEIYLHHPREWDKTKLMFSLSYNLPTPEAWVKVQETLNDVDKMMPEWDKYAYLKTRRLPVNRRKSVEDLERTYFMHINGLLNRCSKIKMWASLMDHKNT
jgi:hypothetical protein